MCAGGYWSVCNNFYTRRRQNTNTVRSRSIWNWYSRYVSEISFLLLTSLYVQVMREFATSIRNNDLCVCWPVCSPGAAKEILRLLVVSITLPWLASLRHLCMYM